VRGEASIMIHSLRQCHRRCVFALGVFLPVAFVAGIAARKPAPVVNELPAALGSSPLKFEMAGPQFVNLFSKTPVEVHLLNEHGNPNRLAVDFSASEDFAKPDLIVHWSAGNTVITDTLPGDAILLGTFSAAPLLLPDAVVKSSGQLVLFSLADNEIVDVSKAIQLAPSTK
jgi:hypothetical protein